MATVTGLTAARMLGIEASSVVSGQVNGEGHLILTTYSGNEIDAGSVVNGIHAYTHFQSVPTTVWVIDHPLTFVPNIIVIDSAGTRVFGSEEVISPTRIRVTFSYPFSGTAYLS